MSTEDTKPTYEKTRTEHRLDMFLKTLQEEKHPGDSCGVGPCSWCWFESLVPEMKAEVEASQAENTRLAQAIQSALSALGTGKCKINTCDGCKAEVEMAIEDLNAALSGIIKGPRRDNVRPHDTT